MAVTAAGPRIIASERSVQRRALPLKFRWLGIQTDVVDIQRVHVPGLLARVRGTVAAADREFLDRRKVHAQIDYLGFEIPDVWVVGFGLDWAERYRALPYIGVVQPED